MNRRRGGHLHAKCIRSDPVAQRNADLRDLSIHRDPRAPAANCDDELAGADDLELTSAMEPAKEGADRF